MSLAAAGRSDLPWRFLNRIPEWIQADEIYVLLIGKNPAYQRVLQAICNGCDRPDAEGNLVGGYRSGRWLAREANVAVSTVWLGINALEEQGYIVPLAIGGTVRVGRKTINASNTYGVPGQRGALEHRRVRREVRRVLLDPDDKRRTEIIRAGDQATLWHKDFLTRSPSDRGRPIIGQGPSDHRTGAVRPSDTSISIPSPVPAPINNHGHGASRSRRRTAGTRSCPNIVDIEQLRHMQLGAPPGCEPPLPGIYGLYLRCHELGLADGSQAGLLRFVAAAVAAVRDGKTNPAGLFASMVNSRAVRDGVSRHTREPLRVTNEDEDKANRMIKRFLERRLQGG